LYRFEVIDTGVGIPPEAQEEIFEPFTQGEGGIHIGGTGLGLAISKKQIELMGGELSLKSEPGVGSRFFFTIPLKPAASDVPVQSSRWNAVRRLAEGYAVKALVADDTKVNQDVLSQILSDIGVEVIEAENGQEALERVQISQPDIAFMDIRMPVMDGIEATRQILGRYGASGPKLVAVSASALIHERHRYFEAGFNDFIAKPIRAERVYECLANLLHVAYEYDADEPEIDLSKMVLPPDLLLRLKKGAALGDVTTLEESLSEVRQIGEHGPLLAKKIETWIQNVDLDAIQNLLGEITHE